jgi:hypothetical protein
MSFFFLHFAAQTILLVLSHFISSKKKSFNQNSICWYFFKNIFVTNAASKLVAFTFFFSEHFDPIKIPKIK